LETDPGSEFKSALAALMIEHNVELRYGKKGRHRQQSVVENRNYAIGYALNQRMASIEQITGQTSRDWVSFLPTVISAFNEQTRDKALKMGKKPKDPVDLGPRCDKKGGCDLLEEGTSVRVILEEPRDNVTDEVLYGKFRAGDRRWDDCVRKIYQVLIRPDQPVLYVVTSPDSDKPDKVAYTRQQLQVTQNNEPEPDANKLNIRGNQAQLTGSKISKSNQDFRVHSLQERRKNGNKKEIEFLVRWREKVSSLYFSIDKRGAWVSFYQSSTWNFTPPHNSHPLRSTAKLGGPLRYPPLTSQLSFCYFQFIRAVQQQENVEYSVFL